MRTLPKPKGVILPRMFQITFLFSKATVQTALSCLSLILPSFLMPKWIFKKFFELLKFLQLINGRCQISIQLSRVVSAFCCCFLPLYVLQGKRGLTELTTKRTYEVKIIKISQATLGWSESHEMKCISASSIL